MHVLSEIVFCKDFVISLLTGAHENTILQSSFPSDVTVIKCTICGEERQVALNIWRKSRMCHIGPGYSDVIDGLCLVAPRGNNIFLFNSFSTPDITSLIVFSEHVPIILRD